MHRATGKVGLIFMLFGILIFSGCATHISKPAKAPTTAKVRFSEFYNIEMKATGISEAFASSEANQRALKKIDAHLFDGIKTVFPTLKRIEDGNDFSKTNVRTLQITPVVKEIKFISGGARFMVGAMAGSSAVLMQATFRDGSTGEVIADPEFYRVANAYAGGWSIGVTDNKMLEEIARDVVYYSSLNK